QPCIFQGGKMAVWWEPYLAQGDTICGTTRRRTEHMKRAWHPEELVEHWTILPCNWLRVLGTAECSQVDQRIRHQLHAIVPLLDALKSEQQPLELVFPRKRPLDTHP